MFNGVGLFLQQLKQSNTTNDNKKYQEATYTGSHILALKGKQALDGKLWMASDDVRGWSHGYTRVIWFQGMPDNIQECQTFSGGFRHHLTPYNTN